MVYKKKTKYVCVCVYTYIYIYTHIKYNIEITLYNYTCNILKFMVYPRSFYNLSK